MKKLAIILLWALLFLAIIMVLGRGGAESDVSRSLIPHAGVPPRSHEMEVSVGDLGIDHVPAYTGPVTDRAALHDGFLHVRGTAWPWQQGNVYLAGHDLGWPGTPSWHLLWNLRDLEPGDMIYLEDSNGTHYEYEVYKQFTVDPSASWVMEPTGERIVTLQTCTPHWTWTKRLVVRARLVQTMKRGEDVRED